MSCNKMNDIMNINEHTVIKVTGNSTYDRFTFIPSQKIRENVCNLINESNLFKPLGKSRIDGYELYKLNLLTIRQIKIDKITKNNNISVKLNELIDHIKDDIDYITVNRSNDEIILL